MPGHSNHQIDIEVTAYENGKADIRVESVRGHSWDFEDGGDGYGPRLDIYAWRKIDGTYKSVRVASYQNTVYRSVVSNRSYT